MNATVLREVLAILIGGCQQALRIRTQGRSTARGALPAWISAATEFSVSISASCTILEIDAPTLAEAAPDEFRQADLFSEVTPDLPAFDYLVDSVEAALEGGNRAHLCDRPMLKLLEGLETVFARGVENILFDRCASGLRPQRVKLVPESLACFKSLRSRIPRPRHVRVAGKLDAIRHSDHTFALLLPSGLRLKGIAESSHLEDLQSLWSRNVMVCGTAYFAADGSVLRIEVEILRQAKDEDLQLWQASPVALDQRRELALREPQGPRSGLNAILGKWPGEETDDEIQQALDELS